VGLIKCFKINSLSNFELRFSKILVALLMSTWALGACGAVPVRSDDVLRVFLQSYLKDPTSEDSTTRYSTATVSLDGKTPMRLVYISGQQWCGSGGCTALLLTSDRSLFKVIQKFTSVQLPIRVLSTTTAGWHDLAFWIRGGGSSPVMVVLRYDGSKYPSNPTIAPSLDSTGLSDTGVELPLKHQGEALYP
jgi:hypothetical protein